jgi:hypothetical protein
MIEDQDRQEARRRSIDAEREELQQATQHFVRSMVRFGIRLAFSSANRLPRGPRRRVQAAGGEITRNLAAFMHTLAEDLQEVTQNTTPSPPSRADPQGETD